MIYVVGYKSKFGAILKIGRTSGSIQKRVQQLQVGCAHQLEIFATFNFNYKQEANDKKHEKLIHNFLEPFRLKGEWFRFDLHKPDYYYLQDIVEAFEYDMISESDFEGYLQDVRFRHQEVPSTNIKKLYNFKIFKYLWGEQ